jgi:hypothetical protein
MSNMIDILIDTCMQIERLSVGRLPLEKNVADASNELDMGPAGYKLTIARAKLRDAEAALAEHDQSAAALRAQIDGMSSVWTAGQYALYSMELERLEAAKIGAEKALEEALETAKTGAWKRKGAKAPAEPAIVVRARQVVAASGDAIDQLEERYEAVKAMVRDLRTWQREDQERLAWYAGGPKPEFVKRKDAAELREFLTDCVSLPLPVKGKPFTLPLRRKAEEEAGAEEKPEVWVSMSIEDYIRSLATPLPVETEPTVASPKKQKPSWVAQYVAARKARLALASC